MAPKVVPAQPGRAPTTSDFPRLIQSSPPGRSPTFEGVMGRLQKKVKQYHMMPSDFFVDYDKHRTGVITLAQFRAGLDAAFGPLNVGVLEVLGGPNGSDPPMGQRRGPQRLEYARRQFL